MKTLYAVLSIRKYLEEICNPKVLALYVLENKHYLCTSNSQSDLFCSLGPGSFLIQFQVLPSLALASRFLSYPSCLFPFPCFVLSPGPRTCLCVNTGIISYLPKGLYIFFFHMSNIFVAIYPLFFQFSSCVICIRVGCLHTGRGGTGYVRKKQITSRKHLKM